MRRESLVRRFSRPRSGRLVFTNGVFDLLHAGHTAYLAQARSLGDVLVVGVNGDVSARELGKGPGRPLNPENDRALVVAALECVDAVCLFHEDTPAELIEVLEPDVLAKGGDYELAAVAGRDVVERGGGRVELIDFVAGYSTTEIIRRIQRDHSTDSGRSDVIERHQGAE